MLYASVQEELWRIFTFYALHGDANQPETMRPANFLRFCKDCQIVSKKINPTAVELEIARMVLLLFYYSIFRLIETSLDIIDFRIFI